MSMATDLAKQAQLDAVEASGSDQAFRLLQPRNPALWVFALGIVVGTVRTVTYFGRTNGSLSGALAAGIVVFGLYAVLWTLFLRRLDRFTPVQPGLLATGFVWGATAATFFLALDADTALLHLYTKAFGATWAHDWAAGLTAPFVEETAKAIGFVLILGLAPRIVRSAYDAFTIGAFVGLGFQIAEDVLYAVQGAGQHFAVRQVPDATSIIVVRSVTGVATHALLSALVCTGIMWLVGRDPRGRDIPKGVVLILLALIAHGSWDAASALGVTLGGRAVSVLVVIGLLAGEIAVIVFIGSDAADSERRWARDLLLPEVTRGSITYGELASICGTRRDRRRAIELEWDRRGRRRARRVIPAGRRLCRAIARAGGTDTPAVERARSELARVRAG
jgi:RsiW-degrading membrane proteinase PrsW (M82 family)